MSIIDITVNDLALLICSIIASTIMILGGSIGRGKKKKAGFTMISKMPLKEKIHSFIKGYPGKSLETFKTKFSPDIFGEFKGTWDCIKLGCGGWGCTYLCRQENKKLVFKVPRGFEEIIEMGIIPTVHEKLLKRIVEESSILSKICHPHILQLIGYLDKIPVLIYEYANYGSLEWQLSKGWKPDFKDILLIGLQIGDALRFIHSRGLIHGDIKPGNVFIVNGIVKLGDFSSLVKLITLTSTHSKFAYTPGFRAPEQVFSDLRRKAVERGLENRIDVYQLGNLLLYLLTGASVDGENVFDVKRKKEILKEVKNPKLREIIEAMLEPDPERRPSIDEVLKHMFSIYRELAKS